MAALTDPSQYEFGTEPFPHQLESFLTHANSPVRALYWEQGVGKTKPLIDTGAYLYEAQEIDCVLVVAPNGVHRNWINIEVPKHLPHRLHRHFLGLSVETNWTRAQDRAMLRCLHHRGLVVVAISYDTFRTDKAKKWLKSLLEKRNCLYILDEADRIKTNMGTTTRAVLASGKYAKYKRIATGTPITLGPFDVYTQMRFLDPDFWKKFPEHGIGDYTSFKTFFGVFKKEKMWVKRNGKATEAEIPQLVSYRNLHILKEIIATVSDRLLKTDVLDFLPEKLYGQVEYDLTPKQRTMYEDLQTRYYTEWPDGEITSAPLAIVQRMRMQQITCGYLPTDDPEDDEVRLIDENPKNNPRLQALLEQTTHQPHPGIIWCRYTKDVDLICDALEKAGETLVRYDGSVSNDDREARKVAFQAGGAKWFVANFATGSDGLTLTAAKTAHYYNNGYRLRDRLQSEDRCHRIGQDGIALPGHEKNAVLYKDYISSGTMDKPILANLLKKAKTAQTVLGDQDNEWLQQSI